VRKITVCIIASQAILNSVGGVEKFVLQLSEWLSNKSIKVIVICSSPRRIVESFTNKEVSQYRDLESNRDIEMFPAYLPPVINSLAFTVLSFLKLMKLHKKHRFSIIHAQDTSYAALAAVLAAKLLGLPVILHSHGAELESAKLMLRSKGLEKSVAAAIYLAFYRMLEKQLIRRSDRVIVVSREVRRHLSKLGISKAKFSVIKVGVDLRTFCKDEEFGHIDHSIIKKTNHDCIIVGFVGRLVPVKNLESLIKAFASAQRFLVKEAKLVIIGDGPMRACLEEEAKKLGIDGNIAFLGVRSDIHRLLRKIDVFVMPSIIEGCPTSLLEAMASGKAIIVSDLPSIRELVRHNEEAILVDPHNVEQLKQAILLLCNNPDLMNRLGHKARERVKLYDINKVYGEILKLYEELVRRKAKTN